MRRLKFNRFWLHLISGFVTSALPQRGKDSRRFTSFHPRVSIWKLYSLAGGALLTRSLPAHFIPMMPRWWSLKSFNYLLNVHLNSFRQLQNSVKCSSLEIERKFHRFWRYEVFQSKCFENCNIPSSSIVNLRESTKSLTETTWVLIDFDYGRWKRFM